ncbi:profilin-4-like [Corticium candelabrum]|uniref:profilin-4-like n=1 Tax=Corticium candelabrum TaxID=121492 RepID=UPI002E27260E|nr:profilin-4-like [Corticium candelabrum]
MNQLQNLLHDTLIATGHVQQCALIKRKDASLKASSVGFTVEHDQAKQLVESFKAPTDLRGSGLLYCGIRYKCVRTDKNSIYAKHNDTGVILARTSSLIIIGTYSTTMHPSICVAAVERLADYFRDKSK